MLAKVSIYPNFPGAKKVILEAKVLEKPKLVDTGYKINSRPYKKFEFNVEGIGLVREEAIENLKEVLEHFKEEYDTLEI